jgi:cell filamentation protein
MNSDYEYIDPDRIYSDQNGVLFNLLGIIDPKLLSVSEAFLTSKRLEELSLGPIPIKSAYSLLDIHRHIFQDIYGWAGETRKVDISKQGKQFITATSFDQAFFFIDGLIRRFREAADDIDAVSERLAEILDAVNFMHPFREGNGRAQREFIRSLALEKGYALDLNPPDDSAVYREYMRCCVEEDLAGLTILIKSAIVPD